MTNSCDDAWRCDVSRRSARQVRRPSVAACTSLAARLSSRSTRWRERGTFTHTTTFRMHIHSHLVFLSFFLSRNQGIGASHRRTDCRAWRFSSQTGSLRCGFFVSKPKHWFVSIRIWKRHRNESMISPIKSFDPYCQLIKYLIRFFLRILFQIDAIIYLSWNEHRKQTLATFLMMVFFCLLLM